MRLWVGLRTGITGSEAVLRVIAGVTASARAGAGEVKGEGTDTEGVEGESAEG